VPAACCGEPWLRSRGAPAALRGAHAPLPPSVPLCALCPARASLALPQAHAVGPPWPSRETCHLDAAVRRVEPHSNHLLPRPS
jgi:hypothetical protein